MSSVTVTNSDIPQPDLPIETATQFLTYLDCDDVLDMKTLMACSQVSRNWNIIVLPFLFSQLTITFVYENVHFPGTERDINRHRRLALDDTYTPKHLSLIPALLQSTAARILPFVRKVRLQQVWDPNPTMRTEIHESNYVDPAPLCDVIRQFPSLKHLRLSEILLRTRPTVTPETTIQDLEELRIELINYHRRGEQVASSESYERRLWMLRLFGSVRQLRLRYIDDTRFIDQDIDFACLFDSFFSAEAVSFSDMTAIQVFLRAFQFSPRTLNKLQSVDGPLLCRAFIFRELAALYAKLPNGLKHLGCGLQMLDSNVVNGQFDGLLQSFTSPGFSNIQSLEFHYIRWTNQFIGNLQWHWYEPGIRSTSHTIRILSSQNLAPRLQRLKFNVKAPTSNEPEGDISLPSDIPEAFSIMQDSLLCFPALKTFVIHAVQQQYETPVERIPPSLRTFYQRAFPTLHRDGRLQITPAKELIVPQSDRTRIGSLWPPQSLV